MVKLLVVGIGFAVVMLVIFIILILRGTSQKRIEKTLTKYGNAVVKAQNNIINNNEEILKETANKTADITKDAVKTIARSIKE